jgi:hypothetical protein
MGSVKEEHMGKKKKEKQGRSGGCSRESLTSKAAVRGEDKSERELTKRKMTAEGRI